MKLLSLFSKNVPTLEKNPASPASAAAAARAAAASAAAASAAAAAAAASANACASTASANAFKTVTSNTFAATSTASLAKSHALSNSLLSDSSSEDRRWARTSYTINPGIASPLLSFANSKLTVTSPCGPLILMGSKTVGTISSMSSSAVPILACDTLYLPTCLGKCSV